MTRKEPVWATVLYPALVIAGLLGVWELAVRFWSVQPYILPAPSRIARVLVTESSELWAQAWITLEELLAGFVCALVVGIALALLIFKSRTLERALYPLIIGSQTIPVFAIAPLLIVWFGYGMLSKVVMTALIVFFPIVVNTVDGLRAADEDAVNLLRVMKATDWQVLWKVRMPSALPFIFSGAKIGVAVSAIGAVIGEWVGSTGGLGFLMIHANARLRVDLIFAAIVYLSTVAVALFLLVSLLEWYALPWRRATTPRPR